MANGQEERVIFQLSHDEKHFVADVHGRHIQCELTKCNVHQFVHLIIRLEAGRQKLEHELEATQEAEMGNHGVKGLCDRCKWTDVEWLTHMAHEWGHQ